MKNKKKDILNILSLSGVFAVVFYFLHVYFGKINYPGYNWMAQAVSDLTAVNSSSFIIASRFTSVYSSLACLCCVIVSIIVSKETVNKYFRLGIYLYTVMNWVSNIGYTLFPLTGAGYNGKFEDIMHFYVVTVSVVLLSIISLLLIIVNGIKEKKYRIISILALVALLCMFSGSIGIGFVSKSYFGLMERFSVFSVVIFTGILGVFGYCFEIGKKA